MLRKIARALIQVRSEMQSNNSKTVAVQRTSHRHRHQCEPDLYFMYGFRLMFSCFFFLFFWQIINCTRILCVVISTALSRHKCILSSKTPRKQQKKTHNSLRGVYNLRIRAYTQTPYRALKEIFTHLHSDQNVWAFTINKNNNVEKK